MRQEFDPNRASQLYGSPARAAGARSRGDGAGPTRDDELKASLGLDDDHEYADDDAFSDEDDAMDATAGGYVPSTLANSASANGANASPAKLGQGGGATIERLSAANDALEHEVAALREESAEAQERARLVEAKSADAASARANALKHLQAAEDHVGLLLNESRKKLEAMARENEKIAAGEHPAGAGGGVAWGAGAGLGGGLAAVERQELDLLRGEVKEYIQTQAEMDAEAEEREGELKIAYEHIKQLQEALGQAKQGVAA